MSVQLNWSAYLQERTEMVKCNDACFKTRCENNILCFITNSCDDPDHDYVLGYLRFAGNTFLQIVKFLMGMCVLFLKRINASQSMNFWFCMMDYRRAVCSPVVSLAATPRANAGLPLATHNPRVGAPSESDEEESVQERPRQQRKRSAPWCATDQAIVKKRSEMQRLARRTALREAGDVIERSASCDSKQADFIRLYLSELDEECTKATGMQLALFTYGTYSSSIPNMIFVIICRLEGYRKAMYCWRTSVVEQAIHHYNVWRAHQVRCQWMGYVTSD